MSSEERVALTHSYWVRKSLLALAIRHPQVILEQDPKIIEVVVKLAHETADAWLKLNEEPQDE